MNRFWKDPERGRTGDHGQDGADGKQGERGLRGPTGGSTPGLRLRMLILYVVVFLLLGVMGTFALTTRHAFRAECLDTRSNTQTINAFIDGLIRSYRSSRVLSPQEKVQRIDAIAPLRQRVPPCPPAGWRHP